MHPTPKCRCGHLAGGHVCRTANTFVEDLLELLHVWRGVVAWPLEERSL